ncbi:UNVERIFIED_CONTAM: hypothetical protein PYX00_009034 [Menopon gallinae]|uniref:Lipase domain-containing protein n=1 Tax=Menopon gallinae TaxID=328185 RepID=A0AAW2H9Q6_9NEOP
MLITRDFRIHFQIYFIPGIHCSTKSIVGDIQTALNLGDTSANYTREECVWRPYNDFNLCPDPDINFFFYSESNPTHGERVNMTQGDFLRIHHWDPMKQNVILIHGYAGGNDIIPGVILRDAYLQNGSYNVFVVDWGQLARIPCYVAAVHNLRTVAQCTAHLFNFIRNTGISSKAITCVGHSLGAHICGLISNYLLFRIHRIIALDPARPLIRNSVRLKPGMAESVQVIHTNAGNYGESGKIGKIDFCLNGGKIQPLCENKTRADLCSHALSICYLAESIDVSNALKATPCSRRCPTGPRPSHRIGLPVLLGEHTPESATGSYCATMKQAPYCSKTNPKGHPWCCLEES